MTGSGQGRMASVSAFTLSPWDIICLLCLTTDIHAYPRPGSVVKGVMSSRGVERGHTAGPGVAGARGAGGCADRGRYLYRLGDPGLPRAAGGVDQESGCRED